MQKDLLAGGDRSETKTSMDSSNVSRNSSLHQPENQSDSIDFASFYPSMFPTNLNSLSMTPSDSSFDDCSANSAATAHRLHQARVVLEYQQLYNRYTMCLAHLQDSLKELDALHEENESLRVVNADLMKRLNLLSQATIQNCLLSAGHTPLSVINDFNRLNIGSTGRENRPVAAAAEEIPRFSPTSVIDHNRVERRGTERVTLPKSISVRSSGYLKLSQRGGSNAGSSRTNRVKSPVKTASQRMCVPAGKKAEEAMELDVYNQGMFKTELCNKWQETGKCPYGENCQFAHGITELRPVIRHPRYKTEVCRMVLAGDACPYGHRCHFRHALTEQERLMGPLRLDELTS